MTAHIDVGFSKCLNFCIIERKLKKNDAAYAFE